MNQPVSREFPNHEEGPPAKAKPLADAPPHTRPTPQALAAWTDTHLPFLPRDTLPIYLVGGTVRDLLIGQMPADIDLAVDGDIEALAAAIASQTGGTIVHLGKGEDTVWRVASRQIIVDLTTLNGETIEANLGRRDFTINAMAYDLSARRLVDSTGGLADMAGATIRMVSPSAFANDPVRLVRAFRLAAAFGFSIEAGTQKAIATEAHRIGQVAGERIWAELRKLLSTRHSVGFIDQMAATGLLTAILPELSATRGCTQNHHHQFDVFEHTLRAYTHIEALLTKRSEPCPAIDNAVAAIESRDGSAILKWACLLHDVGKPATRRTDASGRVRFYGHAARGADITAAICRRLRLSGKESDACQRIVRHHVRPLSLFLADRNNQLGPRAAIRFFNHCGQLTQPILLHAMADIMAKADTPSPRNRQFIDFCVQLLAQSARIDQKRAAEPPLVSGKDLKETFHLSPSPAFGSILREVTERQLAGQLSTRKEALAWIADHLSQFNR